MGNFLVLCISGEIKNPKVLQIMKNDGKILEFRNPILVSELLTNYINSYVGMFKEATQPLPLNYKLKIGKIYHLLPCNLDNQILDVEESRKPSRKSTRVKVVITKEELKRLLLAQNGGIEELFLLGSNNSKSVCSSNNHFPNNNSCNWVPNLESIPEISDDLVC